MKMAVSIPRDLYRAIKRVCQTTGKSPSTVIEDALRLWLEDQGSTAMVMAYKTGYRRRPESRREVKAAQAAAVRLLAAESW